MAVFFCPVSRSYLNTSRKKEPWQLVSVPVVVQLVSSLWKAAQNPLTNFRWNLLPDPFQPSSTKNWLPIFCMVDDTDNSSHTHSSHYGNAHATQTGKNSRFFDARALKESPFVLWAVYLFVLLGLYLPAFFIQLYDMRSMQATHAFYLLPALNVGSFFGRIVCSSIHYFEDMNLN